MDITCREKIVLNGNKTVSFLIFSFMVSSAKKFSDYDHIFIVWNRLTVSKVRLLIYLSSFGLVSFGGIFSVHLHSISHTAPIIYRLFINLFMFIFESR